MPLSETNFFLSYSSIDVKRYRDKDIFSKKTFSWRLLTIPEDWSMTILVMDMLSGKANIELEQ